MPLKGGYAHPDLPLMVLADTEIRALLLRTNSLPDLGHTRSMTDAEGRDHREEQDDEFRFLRWVQDPEGCWFCVEGVKTFGVSGPVFLDAPDSNPMVRRLLNVVNKGLVRVQRPSRSHEGFHIEISRLDGRQEQLVFEESFDVAAKGRSRARTLALQINDGTFSPES
jgi:hypothetical protein